MSSIVYVGMDVHKESYTLCTYTILEDQVKNKVRVVPEYLHILKYLETVRHQYKEEVEFVCGYEAGCLGYSLYHQLTDHGVTCKIMAPSTMTIKNTNGVKTDKNDAGNIAKCLAFRTYEPVYVLTKEDEGIRAFIRMRGDHKSDLKSKKQQILSLLLQAGCSYTGGSSRWTRGHIAWIKSLQLPACIQETLDEYMCTYEYLQNKVERLDKRIEEMSQGEIYKENVGKLRCFMGVETLTALSILVEIGDFTRFSEAGHFASYLGLIPGEHSSGDSRKALGITKKGNSHVRRLLIESAQSCSRSRGGMGHKSAALKKRQNGNDPKVIAYADKANERLRRKFSTMTQKKGKKSNVAATAIARELGCFIWGMLTNHVD